MVDKRWYAVVVLGLLSFITGCSKSSIEVYQCRRAVSENPAFLVNTASIEFGILPRLPANPRVNEQVRSRRTVRVEAEGLSLEIWGMYRDDHTLSVWLNCINRSSGTYRVPTEYIELVTQDNTPTTWGQASGMIVIIHDMNMDFKNDSTEIDKNTQSQSSAIKPADARVAPGTSIAIDPNDKIGIDIKMEVDSFQYATLRIPLNDVANDRKTVLEFDLELMLKFQKGLY